MYTYMYVCVLCHNMSGVINVVWPKNKIKPRVARGGMFCKPQLKMLTFAVVRRNKV